MPGFGVCTTAAGAQVRKQEAASLAQHFYGDETARNSVTAYIQPAVCSLTNCYSTRKGFEALSLACCIPGYGLLCLCPSHLLGQRLGLSPHLLLNDALLHRLAVQVRRVQHTRLVKQGSLRRGQPGAEAVNGKGLTVKLAPLPMVNNRGWQASSPLYPHTSIAGC